MHAVNWYRESFSVAKCVDLRPRKRIQPFIIIHSNLVEPHDPHPTRHPSSSSRAHPTWVARFPRTDPGLPSAHTRAEGAAARTCSASEAAAERATPYPSPGSVQQVMGRFRFDPTGEARSRPIPVRGGGDPGHVGSGWVGKVVVAVAVQAWWGA